MLTIVKWSYNKHDLRVMAPLYAEFRIATDRTYVDCLIRMFNKVIRVNRSFSMTCKFNWQRFTAILQ